MKKHQKKVTKKLIAVILIMALVVGICGFVNTEPAYAKTTSNETTIKYEGNEIIAEEETDGCKIVCKCDKITKAMYLYIDQKGYQVEVKDDEIKLKSLENVPQSSEVQGQSAIALANGVYISASIVKLVCALLCVAGGIAVSTLIKTCNKYKTVKSNASAKEKSLASEISKRKQTNDYFEAKLESNNVYAYKNITYEQAVNRLKKGYDVFAVNKNAANQAARAAANPVGSVRFDKNENGDGYYPHYHPLGRKWKGYMNSCPHCWYPR